MGIHCKAESIPQLTAVLQRGKYIPVEIMETATLSSHTVRRISLPGGTLNGGGMGIGKEAEYPTTTRGGEVGGLVAVERKSTGVVTFGGRTSSQKPLPLDPPGCASDFNGNPSATLRSSCIRIIY